MELQNRAHARLTLRALIATVVGLAGALALPPGAAAAVDLQRPASETEPPPLFDRTASEVERIATRAAKVRAARRDGPLDPVAYTRGAGSWQVSFFRDGREVVQVHVDDGNGAIEEEWSGHQVAWTMARGYPGAFGRKLNAPYVWVPLCLLFLAPFVDVRRPFRLLHLDLLVLLGFGISHVFFNRGEIGVSVPLAYPVLVYLLARVLLAAFRPRPRAGPLIPHAPLTLLVVGLVFLTAFRIGLNVADSNVIDVGYAGVIGADRIVDGDELYGDGFSRDVERGDTYGPLNYLLYVPFEQALPWSGRWDRLPAAHGAAITFDLLAVAGLVLLGRRLRPGRDGAALGVTLAYAWTAYPYTAFALESNANDTLVAVACIGALLATTLARDRHAGAAAGAAVTLGAATKFVNLALAPLFARRAPLAFAGVALLVLLATVAPFVPDAGLRELYDRTVGYQASRPSPFGIWGQLESLDWLQTVVKAAAVALALLVAFVPRRPGARQLAALGAAVLIVIELAATHWFYLYVVWFAPFVFVTIFCAYGRTLPDRGAREREARETVYA